MVEGASDGARGVGVAVGAVPVSGTPSADRTSAVAVGGVVDGAVVDGAVARAAVRALGRWPRGAGGCDMTPGFRARYRVRIAHGAEAPPPYGGAGILLQAPQPPPALCGDER